MEAAFKREAAVRKQVFPLFYFLIFFAFGALFPLLSVYLQEEARLSGAAIGWIMSLPPIVTMAAQPLWGTAADYTRKPVELLTLALGVTALFGLLYSLAGNYQVFVALTVLLSAAQSAIVPLSDSIALHHVRRSGGNYGAIRLWGSIGFAASVLVVGWLSDHVAFAVIFYAFSLALLAASVLAARLPRYPMAAPGALTFQDVRGLLSVRSFQLLLVATFLLFGPIYANNSYFGLLIHELGGTLTGIGFAFWLAAGSEAPFMKTADRLIRRFGMTRLLVLAALVSAARWWSYVADPPLWFVYITAIVQGCSVGLAIPTALQYVRRLAPERVQATAVALYSATSSGLGAWFCTLVGGYLFERWQIGAVYVFFGACTIVGVFVLIWLGKLEKTTKSAGEKG
ncbi:MULTISPECIES: maltose permease [Geobacillus]|uniref:Maltose permease n=2 Tax=Geobacillus thermoleovorans group TaxID=1505648 RepID=U2X0Q2_GEOKU|nr:MULTISPECIES: maltose permease [Geobacillus]AEV20486.1 Maltose permease [Geobacillus thermoleovorans CCB_US3_UF5]AMV12010.1 MFS transporter [Geobacillus thermoleovorans]QDY74384.1 MFS transporter [Geobacillus thermoleovorans]TLS32207.1 MFS transporter [Geobacillus thermoleovorans]TRY43829.1 MFS transporter [Geobacillus sp. LEMMJ02]